MRLRFWRRGRGERSARYINSPAKFQLFIRLIVASQVVAGSARFACRVDQFRRAEVDPFHGDADIARGRRPSHVLKIKKRYAIHYVKVPELKR